MMCHMMTQPHRQSLLLRYGSIGGMATALHYMVFVALLSVTTPVYATLTGGMSGAIFSYVANKHYTFVSDGKKTLNPARFYLVTLIYNATNTGLMYLALQCLPIYESQYWVLIQLAITVTLSVISYFIHKYWSYHYV